MTAPCWHAEQLWQVSLDETLHEIPGQYLRDRHRGYGGVDLMSPCMRCLGSTEAESAAKDSAIT